MNSNESVFWADDFGRFDKAMSVHHLPCFGAAAITPADRVLDVGCGTGRTTLHAARAATAGSVLGVDLSAGMIGYARREGLGNVTFAQADAQVHLFYGRRVRRGRQPAPGPFALGNPELIRALLTVAGFTRVQIRANNGGMWFGRDDAYRFVRALMSRMAQRPERTRTLPGAQRASRHDRRQRHARRRHLPVSRLGRPGHPAVSSPPVPTARPLANR